MKYGVALSVGPFSTEGEKNRIDLPECIPSKVHVVLWLYTPQYHTRYERVAEGTKFSFARTGSTQLVKGRGPLLGAILVGVTGDQGKEGEIMVK